MAHRHRKFHLLVIGTGGYGKSTYAEKFVANAPDTSCVFLFDPDGDFAEEMDLTPCTTPAEIDQAVKTGFVCYDPTEMYPGETEKGLEYFCRYAYERSDRLPGRKFLVIDELWEHCDGGPLPKALKVCVKKGRHVRLDCVFISHTPNEVHNSIRAQVTEVVCFNVMVDDGLAQKWLKNFGFDLDELRQLPQFHYIARNKRGGETRGH
jgi:GTPase SAR1 family protein